MSRSSHNTEKHVFLQEFAKSRIRETREEDSKKFTYECKHKSDCPFNDDLTSKKAELEKKVCLTLKFTRKKAKIEGINTDPPKESSNNTTVLLKNKLKQIEEDLQAKNQNNFWGRNERLALKQLAQLEQEIKRAKLAVQLKQQAAKIYALAPASTDKTDTNFVDTKQLQERLTFCVDHNLIYRQQSLLTLLMNINKNDQDPHRSDNLSNLSNLNNMLFWKQQRHQHQYQLIRDLSLLHTIITSILVGIGEGLVAASFMITLLATLGVTAPVVFIPLAIGSLLVGGTFNGLFFADEIKSAKNTLKEFFTRSELYTDGRTAPIYGSKLFYVETGRQTQDGNVIYKRISCAKIVSYCLSPFLAVSSGLVFGFLSYHSIMSIVALAAGMSTFVGICATNPVGHAILMTIAITIALGSAIAITAITFNALIGLIKKASKEELLRLFVCENDDGNTHIVGSIAKSAITIAIFSVVIIPFLITAVIGCLFGHKTILSVLPKLLCSSHHAILNVVLKVIPWLAAGLQVLANWAFYTNNFTSWVSTLVNSILPYDQEANDTSEVWNDFKDKPLALQMAIVILVPIAIAAFLVFNCVAYASGAIGAAKTAVLHAVPHAPRAIVSAAQALVTVVKTIFSFLPITLSLFVKKEQTPGSGGELETLNAPTTPDRVYLGKNSDRRVHSIAAGRIWGELDTEAESACALQ